MKDTMPGCEGMLKLLALLPAPTRAQMVAMYRETLTSQLRSLQTAFEGFPGEELAPLVHKLAGSAAMMQDPDLSVPARAMERALRSGDGETAASHWPEVRAAAARTLVALEPF
ncbi:Hpt domain-containing protein [Ramlibacter humi]|uniref:Hpt domain-containing protein n=2 Tax=Ramlibacter humi TaxID=2530451 RepID=A0A4Z0C9G1_9BURK|nr:Hpt domain-containing protein [Ramlibacter humi]